MATRCEHRRPDAGAPGEKPCPALELGVFERHRVDASEPLPAQEAGVVDVAVLDMNHGWPNVGHEGVQRACQDVACDLAPELARAGLRLRTVSFDVRRTLRMPDPGDARFAVYLGTGGPGHLDPRLNDGRDANAQGISEDPAWETPLFRLFDSILERDEASLLAVCHSFGLMCRWLAVADPVPRGADKGGKSEGVKDNLLTDAALEHPMFASFASRLAPGGRLRVLDSRIYDLLPKRDAAKRVTIVGNETAGVDGPRGPAMTMMEVARDASGRMPRMFGVNHHPEIIDRRNLMSMLRLRVERGEVSRDWYEQRVAALAAQFPDDDSAPQLHVTSEFTLLGPLRFHVTRALRRRAEALGRPFVPHEQEVEKALISPSPAA